MAVSKIDKIQFESNSQQKCRCTITVIAVSKIDKIQFESNSQHYAEYGLENAYAVSKIDKIQFESNSQQLTDYNASSSAVSKIDKIQFESNSQHTNGSYHGQAVSKIDKIQFESNSQPLYILVLQWQLCQRSIKYNLKAIHNHCCKYIDNCVGCVKDR